MGMDVVGKGQSRPSHVRVCATILDAKRSHHRRQVLENLIKMGGVQERASIIEVWGLAPQKKIILDAQISI